MRFKFNHLEFTDGDGEMITAYGYNVSDPADYALILVPRAPNSGAIGMTREQALGFAMAIIQELHK